MERDRYKNWCKALTKLIEKNSAKINFDKIEPETILDIIIENSQTEKSICLNTVTADADESKKQHDVLGQEKIILLKKFLLMKNMKLILKMTHGIRQQHINHNYLFDGNATI